MTKNYNSSDHTTWKNRFTKKDSQWDDLKRAGTIIVPIVFAIFTSTIYVLFYVSFLTGWLETASQSQEAFYSFLTKLIPLMVLPIAGSIIILSIVLKLGEQFIVSFYLPSENLKLRPLINRRLFGVPPMPEGAKESIKYPFITLRKTEDLEENHWARWLGGPATLVIYDGLALYLERGNQFSRVVGPGLPMPLLERYETIKAIIDLRPQVKNVETKTWTKDGIELKIDIRVEVQINCSDEAKRQSIKLDEGQTALHLVYPFDPIAVQTAVERTAVRMNSDKSLSESTWDGAAMGTVTGKLKAYIAAHSIYELFQESPNSPQFSSFKVSEELFESINTGLTIAGSKLLSLQIMDISPVDQEIIDDLIEYWEAQKKRRDLILTGEVEAERVRTNQRAHMKAQQNMLDTLIDSLEKMNKETDDGIDVERFTETSILLLASMLEQNLENPLLSSYLAKESLDMLATLREQLDL